MNENKSLTQMLSEGSRDDQMVLKPSHIVSNNHQHTSGVMKISATPTVNAHNASPTFYNSTIVN